MKTVVLTLLLIGMILAGNLCWITRVYRPNETDSPVEILVVDDFKSEDFFVEAMFGSTTPHGETVVDTARQWSLGSCPIRTFDAYLRDRRSPAWGSGSPDRSYQAALAKAAAHVTRHPDKKFILNLSLGSARPNPTERALLADLAGKGVIIVAAAGNEDSKEPSYPAAYDHVIAVAASTSGKKADYSNYGPHVDLAVDTTQRKYVNEQRVSRDVVRVSIRTEVGTSLSAPKLAGMLALAWDAKPHMTRDDLLTAMAKSCFPMTDEHYTQGNLGKGQIDDYSMIFAHSPTPTRMALLLLAELAGFLAIHMLLFSRQTLRLGAITFFLFTLGMFTAYGLCGLANTLMWGYSFTAVAFGLFLGLYLLLRTSPLVPADELATDSTDYADLGI